MTIKKGQKCLLKGIKTQKKNGDTEILKLAYYSTTVVCPIKINEKNVFLAHLFLVQYLK